MIVPSGSTMRVSCGQRGVGVDGSHAEEGDDPHPEDGAGAAGQNGAGGAHDIAGTHLRGDGGGQRLKGAHTGVLLAALQLQVAEHLAHTLTEAAHLHETGLDGVPQTHADQQKHQNVVTQVLVDLTHDGKQYGFDGLHVDSLLFRRKIEPLLCSDSGETRQTRKCLLCPFA